MFAKECLSEINQVWNGLIGGICPVARELKTVAGLLGFLPSHFTKLLNVVATGSVGIILCICAIGYNKDLNVFKEPRPSPKTITSVAFNLIEGFTNLHSTAFKFDMNQGQTIN